MKGSLFALAPDGVDVFYAQQQLAPGEARKSGVAKRGIGVPKMQAPVRRRREAEDFLRAGRRGHFFKNRRGEGV